MNLVQRYAYLKCLFYLMVFCFTYLSSNLISDNYEIEYLNTQLNKCEYNLTTMDQLYSDYSYVLMYDTNHNKINQCILPTYFYDKCFNNKIL